ncbi:MAG: hypothetical protein ABIP30_00435 [Ferruginibacter sp.]
MRLLICFLIAITIVSCHGNNKIPDVSNIKISLTTYRFERGLFSLNTNNLGPGLDQLIAKYPSFGENFLSTVLNTDPKWPADSTLNYVKSFIYSYRPVYDSAEIVFKDFTPYEKEIEKGLQFVHFYFPKYKTPTKIITYIGPLDGYGDILDEDAFIVGLHQHLGKNYSAYKTVWVMETYPDYMSKRFEPEYISINCMRNIVTDIYPEKMEDKTLVVQMVEKGKRLYMLSKLLPYTAENKLISYTDEQLKGCYSHEAAIWDLFVQNNFLQTIDYNITKNYIGEGPKTQELGDASPGNVGSFSGWQIVKKYMDKNPSVPLKQLMETDAEKIFAEAKYKP